MLLDGEIFQKFGLRVEGNSLPKEMVCLYPADMSWMHAGWQNHHVFPILQSLKVFHLLTPVKNHSSFFFHLLSSFHLASCLNCGSSVSPLNIGNSQGSILIPLVTPHRLCLSLEFQLPTLYWFLEFYISICFIFCLISSRTGMPHWIFLS